MGGSEGWGMGWGMGGFGGIGLLVVALLVWVSLSWQSVAEIRDPNFEALSSCFIDWFALLRIQP